MWLTQDRETARSSTAACDVIGSNFRGVGAYMELSLCFKPRVGGSRAGVIDLGGQQVFEVELSGICKLSGVTEMPGNLLSICH